MNVPETTLQFRAAFKYAFKHSLFKNKKAVAEAARVSPSTISEIMTKKSYGPHTQAKIARAFGYDLIDFLALGRKLLEGEGAIKPRDPSFVIEVTSDKDKHLLEDVEERFRGIPLYESGKLAAGENGLMFDPFEEPGSTLVIDPKEFSGRSHHNLMGLRVGGISMSPVIPQGAAVIIDLDDREFVNNKIYAVNYPKEGENIAAVKRVQKWKHGFVLMSYHPDFPPELSELDWRDLCLGRAIWVGRAL